MPECANPKCKKDFCPSQKGGRHKKFCSNSCKNNFFNFLKRKKKSDLYKSKLLIVECPACEKKFLQKRIEQIFCCRAHGFAVNYRRRNNLPISDIEFNKIRKKNPSGMGCINRAGYRMHTINGKSELEHRKNMKIKVGRELFPHETVHHINGDRLDNRIENLELWSKSHPSGQRVSDKLEWAVNFIKQYGLSVQGQMKMFP